MAEAILPCVLEKLGSLVTPYVTEEFKLQRGLTKELESIKNELEIIKAFLRDAEEKANQGSELVKTWVSQVRTVAYKIEDIIDEYILLTLSDIQRQPKNACFSIPYKVVQCIMDLKPKHDIGCSISDVKSEILLLQQRKITYDLKMVEIVSSNWQDPRVGFLYSKDSDLVGIDDPKDKIFELLDFEVKDPRCSVISITGMGGIGKTTLARKVYDHVEAKRYFYVRAWVNVNKYYDRKNIFKGMLREFYNIVTQPTPSGLGEMEEESLIDELRNFLNDKRYMVVFDDVWDLDLWHHVKNALPDNGKGSKILMTTRQVLVAGTWKASWAKSHIYKTKLLLPDQSWDLFCKKTFLGEYNGQCPKWLETISRHIVDRCEGLPLAIVTISGLLSTKDKVYNEWRRFHDSLSSQLQQNRQLTNVSRILLLSYNDMPYYLKPCLVYFGVFPQGSSIEYNRLIKLWTAEDFIQRKRGIEIEDVAKDYLLELMQRSLVHVSTWYDSGRARTFRVHDLIHEILWPKLEELNFCRVLEEENPEFNIQSRRLSIQEQSLDEVSKSVCVYDKSNIRSILQFRAQELSETLSSSILERVCLLKVLDLQSAPLEQIPKEIGDLLLLQYLSLRFTKVKSLPKSIGKLKNLLTLDLKRCPISELPTEIRNLRKLRHFIVYQNKWHDVLKIWVIGAVKVPNKALSLLENLQKLADINVAESDGFLDQLSKFKKLKYLAISNVKTENSQVLCKAIEKLHSLESLNITVDYDSTDPLDLQYVTSIPLQLQRLYLIGPLKQFPEWIGGLENLNKLRFRGSKLKDIPFQILKDLPNLTMLGINKDVYYGEKLVFETGGFKKLKAMYFDSLINLHSVEIQRGALTLLEDLLIHRSPKLNKIPLGLKYLEKLTSLKVVEMSDDFVKSISILPHIVQHVADIRVGYQTPDGIYKYEKISPSC